MDLKALRVTKTVNDDILGILNKNVIGTPGSSMLYQHLNVTEKIKQISNPYFVSLVRDQRIIGTCCFCKRETVNSGINIHSFYVRYFSFVDKHRRISKRKTIPKNGLVRSEITSVLSGKGLDTSATDKMYQYAYVDPRNLRSAALCKEFGFESVRQYTTVIFTRLSPRLKKGITVSRVLLGEELEIKQLLLRANKKHNMFSLENLFRNGEYNIIKDEAGTILVGAYVNPDHWKILALPGLFGRLLLSTFPYLPVLKRLLNRDYRFLTLEGIYYKRGYEDHLEALFEGLLAKYHLNSAIIVVDAQSQLYDALRSLNLGLVDRLNKEIKGDIICRFVNFTEEEKEIFKTNPAYISGTDVT